MGNYWAKFEKINGKYYRFDTRIYLESISEISPKDECIGAIVGKNPGSAMPKNDLLRDTLGEIDLKNDKLLPTVKNLISKQSHGNNEGKYVQVLNLFYLCNPDLSEAIKDFKSNSSSKTCLTEKNYFPWVWFMWGGYNKDLNIKKQRFKKLQYNQGFYLNNQTKIIEYGFPEDEICARHTQGMKHELVKKDLCKLLNNCTQ